MPAASADVEILALVAVINRGILSAPMANVALESTALVREKGVSKEGSFRRFVSGQRMFMSASMKLPVS